MKLVNLFWKEHHDQMFDEVLSNLAEWFFYGNVIGTCTVLTYFSTLFVFHLAEADFLFLATRCSCLPQYFYIALHAILNSSIYRHEECIRVTTVNPDVVVFFQNTLEFFTRQECQYCQLRFSCAIRNETVTIRFSAKSPRCSSKEHKPVYSLWFKFSMRNSNLGLWFVWFFFFGGGGDLMRHILWAFWDILVIFDHIKSPFPPQRSRCF